MVDRRAAGEPLQYVIGRWGFRSLDLIVDTRVLIPRPETEQVVDVAIGELERLRREGPRRAIAADLGTGSGAIALSMALEATSLEVWAVDVSREALAVARANLAGLGGRAAARVRLVEGDWFSALPTTLRGALGLVVTNPPYVAEGEVSGLEAEVAGWEPRGALVAGPTGLEAIAAIIEQSPRWLARPGALVTEIAPHQADAARRCAEAAGFDDVCVVEDLAGRRRVLVARQ
jgi:release factor glutamine methyltransferase